MLVLTIISPAMMANRQPLQPDSAVFSVDSIRIGLLTAMPGPEIYELYGHSALRITTAQSDDVVNYGVFDFDQPGFIARFVSGKTDYKVIGYPFEFFLMQYRNRGSKVVEQELNLTNEQKEKLLQLLSENLQPENATYRYKYLTNNCATKILDKIDEATNQGVLYPDKSRFESVRTQMAEFNANYPWYQFGIDMVLGMPLDERTTARQQNFMPVIMQLNVADAKLKSGDSLVNSTNVIYQGRGDVRLDATPWYFSPIFIFCIVFVAALVSVLLGRTKLFAPVWFIAVGLVGCLIWFLTFVSEHEATSPNLLALWAGPHAFLAAWVAAAGCRKMWMRSYMLVYAAACLVVCACSFFQHLNFAMWPILLTTLLYICSTLIVPKKIF